MNESLEDYTRVLRGATRPAYLGLPLGACCDSTDWSAKFVEVRAADAPLCAASMTRSYPARKRRRTSRANGAACRLWSLLVVLIRTKCAAPRRKRSAERNPSRFDGAATHTFPPTTRTEWVRAQGMPVPPEPKRYGFLGMSVDGRKRREAGTISCGWLTLSHLSSTLPSPERF